MPRHILATHYLGAREPHVVSYDDAAEVIAAAAHRRRTGAGVIAVVVSRAVDDLHPGIAGGPIPGSRATMEGA